MSNVVGANHGSICAAQPAPDVCTLCAQIPELNACSGDGYCEMQFAHPGTKTIMQVDTYGPTEDWTQEDSGMRVTDWRFADTPEP